MYPDVEIFFPSYSYALNMSYWFMLWQIIPPGGSSGSNKTLILEENQKIFYSLSHISHKMKHFGHRDFGMAVHT